MSHSVLRIVWLGLALAGPIFAQAPARSIQKDLSLARAKTLAASVDSLLDQGLKAIGKEPTVRIDDAAFLRRAYLQIVGRIPTEAEASAFLGDLSSDKRAHLVDALLDSPGHTSTMANWWFDLLRVKSRQRQLSGEPFAHWIREAIRCDLPYDQFVRELVTATGPGHKEGCGATGYLLRDANMPHDAMANTLRLFLGTRLECAQCHNHPTEHWTQKDFYAMAAFFGGIRYRADVNTQTVATLRKTAATGSDREKQAARRILQTMGNGIAGSGTGIERLPDDYKYEDGKPKDPVFATTIFGAKVELPRPPATAPGRPRLRARMTPMPSPEVQSRDAFAGWLTSARNQRFLTVITGRMWQRTFGRGLIEPVDDLKESTQAVYPELQRHLESMLVELDFDLRQFERVLCLTQLFQRACPTTDPAEDQAFAFQGPMLRRLSAEQIWDSLLTLVFADLDDRIRPTDARARDVYDRFAQLEQGSEAQLEAMLNQTPRPQATTVTAQATAALLPDSDRQAQGRALLRQYTVARRAGNTAEMDRLVAQFHAMGFPVPGERAARGREGDLLRASDLVQPAAQGHLLRQFGQSDRETIDAGNREANVPQALTLLNGFLDQRVLSGGSSLRQSLSTARTPTDRVRTAFLCTLSRPPRSAELAVWVPAIERDSENATRDLVWVLCNSNEFRFQP